MTRLMPCSKKHDSIMGQVACEKCQRFAAYESLKQAKVVVNGVPWVHPENK